MCPKLGHKIDYFVFGNSKPIVLSLFRIRQASNNFPALLVKPLIMEAFFFVKRFPACALISVFPAIAFQITKPQPFFPLSQEKDFGYSTILFPHFGQTPIDSFSSANIALLFGYMLSFCSSLARAKLLMNEYAVVKVQAKGNQKMPFTYRPENRGCQPCFVNHNESRYKPPHERS